MPTAVAAHRTGGCRGRGFKSRHSDQTLVNYYNGLELIGFPFEADEM